MHYVKTFFRLLLGVFMTYAGYSHLTFNRLACVAQVPMWLRFSDGFTDFVVVASGVGEIALGPGIAVSPAAGAVVVAPCDGKVSVAFPTGHAYGIKSASGVQVLIHIGMDTVKLEGKGFTPRVAKGDIVKRGDVLAEVDWDVIREAGYDTITPMVVTNKKKFGEITPAAPGPVGITDTVVTVSPKEA